MKPARRIGLRDRFLDARRALESAVAVVVLVVVFRGFVSQAFVIPTGSMAPTLYGEHIDHVCSSCGYSFAAGVHNDVPPREIRCPNCDWIDRPAITPAQVDGGDGIFVINGPFLPGRTFGLQRWDVIVFKAPCAGLTPIPEPDGQTNYIKRLMGLPGEILEIVDGDLYVAEAASVPADIRDALLRDPPALTDEQRNRLDRLLRIARKTPAAQDALWSVVHNADYPAARATAPRWADPDARDPQPAPDPRRIRFGAAESRFLQLVNKGFLDDYGYNGGDGRYIVSDLRLGCVITWQGGDGTARLCLSWRDTLYTAEICPRTGQGRLSRQDVCASKPPEPLGDWQASAWTPGRPVRLALANVDDQLRVEADNRILWQSDPKAPGRTAAQAKALGPQLAPPVVRIGAQALDAEFTHVLLERDVYYRDNASREEIIRPMGPATPEAVRYAGRPGWATRSNPMLLGGDEYFVLGDNSPRSLDSRFWCQTGRHLLGRNPPYRVGTVPGDQIVGKAFVVHWPSWGRLLGSGPRVIPNIGEVRWVH